MTHPLRWALAAAILAMTIPAASVRSEGSLGYFEAHADVGTPAIAGTAAYDPATQAYRMSAAGTNMWLARDEFHFAWRKMTGDFLLTANVRLEGAGVDPHRKLGLMIRTSLDPGSPYVDVAAHGDGLTSMQFRRAPGANTEQVQSAVSGADVLQIERRGKTFIMSVARSGDPFTRDELTGVDLGDEAYVGLFLCSHNAAVSESAVFRNVRITVPPKKDWVPYRDYIGSNVEVLSLLNGDRTVVATSPISIQAPNWTRDGKSLLWNSEGKLSLFDLVTRTPTVLDTGFATRNNNDHVLSFDGTLLGISHHSADDKGQSVIYTLPATGGTPKRITAKSPSYFHGFSPDAKWLVFTGQRDGELDIYRISADGGEETRLTTAPGVDDGPEYTPDGQWVYFNSTRTGRMQIWRMKPDGSDQQAITNDGFNNWFPHPSPDGKTLVVLSFGTDVAPGDHPFYRHVYIRTMGMDGSNPKVVAYLFGGQGTINVPSWSPDGARIAFVSNTALTAPH
jgi:Tol biopolymer transport system component